MLKTDIGRRAITAILTRCAGNAHVVSHLKKFALGCKFFEYIYEPALAMQNSIFYGSGLHLYVGNLLFAMLRTREASAEIIFDEFSKFMRDGEQSALEKLFPGNGILVDTTSDPLANISVFAMIHRESIQDEYNSIRGDGLTPHWVLDLTTTSLHSVLSHWGELYDQMDVYCDKSKPLQSETDFLKVMVGRRDHVKLRVFGKEKQYTYNLLDLPKLVDSRSYAGVQIADVFASAIAKAHQQDYWGKADHHEKEWLSVCEACISNDSIWPNLSLVDLRRRSGFVNAAVLQELTRRSLKRESLFDGMNEIIEYLYQVFPQYLADTENLEDGR